MKHTDYDGTRRVKTAYQPHEDKLYVQQDSSEFEKRLANDNQRLRSAVQTGKGDVRLHLQMSEQDYEQLLKQYPKLRGGTAQQRRTLWLQIAKQRPDLVAMEFQPRVFAPGG